MAIQKLEKEGVTYNELRIQCPNCRSKGVTTPNYSFKHYDCGGRLMLGDNALVHCSECDETVPLVDSMLCSLAQCAKERRWWGKTCTYPYSPTHVSQSLVNALQQSLC